MSYIAFDLDAFDAAESAARHAGASADAVMAGLLRLWRFCWRQKTDRVSTDQLRGVFGIDAGPALAAFGFIEASQGGYRVKGADRYLRISAAQSEGGKKSKGNLKQYRKPEDTTGSPAGSPPAAPPAPLRLEPELNTGSYSEQRTANSDKRISSGSAKKPRTEKPADPRLGPLIGRLKASRLELIGDRYEPTKADGAALKSLLPKGDDDEIDRRWRKGLSADQYSPKCATFLQLSQRWPDLGIERGKPQQVELRVGGHETPPTPCGVCGFVSATAFGGISVCYGHIDLAQDEARRQAPDAPWTANLTQWAKQLAAQGAAA